jgi:phosphoribosyl-dephospho-CoA transferase
MQSSSNLGRHTLVWTRPECHEAVAAQVADDAMRKQTAAWLASDRPLVVASQPRNDHDLSDTISSDSVSVGLSLPPLQCKRRIALRVAAHDIVRFTPPLRLAEAIMHAPAVMSPALSELNAAAMNIELELRVFGSLSWQALSGLPYMTPYSDVDLIWHPISFAQLQQGITLLESWERNSGLHIDGEVLFGSNSAVSWREWALSKSAKDQRVLVKRNSSSGLVNVRELLELLA